MSLVVYDAIVIGARVAGSPTAMLLARKGYRVLLVGRANFPSDTLSTHQIQLPGGGEPVLWRADDGRPASGLLLAAESLPPDRRAWHGQDRLEQARPLGVTAPRQHCSLIIAVASDRGAVAPSCCHAVMLSCCHAVMLSCCHAVMNAPS